MFQEYPQPFVVLLTNAEVNYIQSENLIQKTLLILFNHPDLLEPHNKYKPTAHFLNF
jgi:hypothetical protein